MLSRHRSVRLKRMPFSFVRNSLTAWRDIACSADLLPALRNVNSDTELSRLMDAIAKELGFRFWALIHHDDLRCPCLERVNLMDYPSGAVHRIVEECRFRRDPIVRGSLYAGGAFIWSQINQIIVLDRYDHTAFECGAKEGLNEGITVPYRIMGECPGSCTFAGTRYPEKAERLIGLVQMIGVFAFQSARRLAGNAPICAAPIRLHPRLRDCVVLAGRGLSNKEIARALGITPRTVDGYLTEAYRLFDVHGRTELVVSAVLAGEIGLHELMPRQPE